MKYCRLPYNLFFFPARNLQNTFATIVAILYIKSQTKGLNEVLKKVKVYTWVNGLQKCLNSSGEEK